MCHCVEGSQMIKRDHTDSYRLVWWNPLLLASTHHLPGILPFLRPQEVVRPQSVAALQQCALAMALFPGSFGVEAQTANRILVSWYTALRREMRLKSTILRIHQEKNPTELWDALRCFGQLLPKFMGFRWLP